MCDYSEVKKLNNNDKKEDMNILFLKSLFSFEFLDDWLF